MTAIDPQAAIPDPIDAFEPFTAGDSAHINSDLAPTELSRSATGASRTSRPCGSRCRRAFRPTRWPRRLIDEGMNWWQALATIFLGNVIVLLPMVLNAHAGTKYGIPFPVYCRASFGILGANVPALCVRSSPADGSESSRGSAAGRSTRSSPSPFRAWEKIAPIPWLDINTPQLGCFLAFWAINMLVIYLGIDSIRLLLNIKAPLSDRAGAGAAGLGLSPGERVRSDAVAAVAV